ncbi:hypothetical protein WJX73_002316 [Symbiochloris irregularis]|uniref:Protein DETOXIFICATION n=1 Tax=Symbiochloris irregularis TaxID=706552 RepID=A0AAW1PJ61_9CHLO
MSEGSRQPLLESLPVVGGPSGKDDSTWSHELKQIIKLCGPAVVQLCFQQAMIVTNQVMAGHLGKNELAAVAISLTFFNLMWYFLLGVSSALDTLGSQAFGAADRSGVICWSVAAASVMSVLAVPMAMALYVGDWVAIHFFQQPEYIAVEVATYCQGIIPGLWPFVWSLIIMKALQAQNVMWIPAIVTVVSFFVNIGCNYVLISLYGFEGAAYAQSASRIIQFFMLVGVVGLFLPGCISFHREAWMALPDEEEEEASQPNRQASTTREIADAFDTEAQGESSSDELSNTVHDSTTSLSPPSQEASPSLKKQPSAESSTEDDSPPFSMVTLGCVIRDGLSFKTQWEFLKLGMPGGLMMAAEASSFDITTAMAGLLGTVEVDAHTSLLTLCEFTFVTVPFGIATATTIRVGNMLGANRPNAAKRAGQLSIALCMTFSVIIAALMFGFRANLGNIFVSDKEVIKAVQHIAWLAAFYQFPDCLFGSISGILRGIGRQAQLLWINLFGFWAIGVLLGYYLTFPRHMGIKGLWVGLNTGLMTSSVIVVIVLLMVDWEGEARNAQETIARMAAENAGLVAIAESSDEELSDPETPTPPLRRPSANPGASLPNLSRQSRSRPANMPPPNIQAHLSRSSMQHHHPQNNSYVRPSTLERHSVSSLLSGQYNARIGLADPVTQSFR